VKTKAATVAQKLMNLYRSAFAIDGTWSAVNPVFVTEADAAVLGEIEKLPCGKFLTEHISNLRNGRTNMNSIEPELLPYDGLLDNPGMTKADDGELRALARAMSDFQPDREHLDAIKALPIVRRFGDAWAAGVKSALRDAAEIAMWNNVIRADTALRLWTRAAEILSAEQSERIRAEIQADLPEYETYLPLFGDDGAALLSRLRKLLTDN